jgi:hypothetical protein
VSVIPQVLKLGCGHVVKTPYYLITDADTFFLNPFGAGASSAVTSRVGTIALDQYRKEILMQPTHNGSDCQSDRHASLLIRMSHTLPGTP